MAASSTHRVVKAAGIVMAAIFVSRVLGFVRERAVAEVFGRTEVTDVFFAAFALPDLMYQLLVGGTLSSAFIPVFSQYLAQEQEEEAWYVASTFLNVTVLLLVAFLILGLVFTPLLAPFVGVGFIGEQRQLLVLLMRVTFPAVFFTALSGLQMGILNSYQQFTRPAAGPILYNLSQILGAYFLGPLIGIMGMAVGTVAGSIGSFTLQLPVVLRKRSFYRRVIDLSHPGVRKMGRLMLPALVGLGISQVNLIVAQNLASLLETGSLVALRLANRLIHFPLGVFAMGLSTALFPTLARLAARNEMTQFCQTFAFGLRVVFYITIPSAVGLAVLRVPIVRLLFQSGAFTAEDTEATAYAVLFYAAGLLALAGLQILTRVFYSLQDTLTPVRVGLVTVLINFVISLAFLRWTGLGHGGLALAFSLTSTLNMVIFLLILRRRLGGIDGRTIVDTLWRSLAAAGGMAAVVHYTAVWSSSVFDLAGFSGRMAQVFIAIGLGAASYLGLSFLLRMQEPRYVLHLLRRRDQA